MNTFKKNLPFIVQIIISAIFLLSAVAKSFPIWAFEKQLVDLGIVDWCKAPYLARLIIALETAIAIAILQKHYLKKFVIPVTIILLIAFCAHLGIQMYEHGAMNGNCGCFGQLIPMTPLEAVIKNLVTIGLLIYLYKNVTDKPKEENRFVVILFIYFLSAFIMFFIFPFCPCSKNTTNAGIAPNIITVDSTINTDSSEQPLDSAKKQRIDSVKIKAKVTDSTTVAAIKEPAHVQSVFYEYNNFSGQQVNLDKGKKIVCLFVPGCDHCREAAKELVNASKSNKLPPVYILFMNEETFKIPEFFQEIKKTYPYYVIDDIPTFFKLLGNRATTPGVTYLWNGNVIKSYEGIENHKFNVSELIKIINQP